MSKQTTKHNLVTAVGAALMGSLALGTPAQAAETSFSINELDGGYMQLAMNEGNCGEGKCGGDKKATEGKCGGDKTTKEGKCGEGKCGGDKKAAEGKCGGDKKAKEGKCGEGKCGGSK